MGTKYTKEFKKEAIRLGEREGVAAASEKLGIGTKTLYAWQRAERLERGEAPEGLRPGESPEQGFKRLERENQELRDVNYILKKAMGFIPDYVKILENNNISVMYSGPVWTGGIDGMAEMLQRRLDFDSLPLSASQSVFSVFVEQINNMMMYSAEKETFEQRDGGSVEVSKGIFILGIKDKTYFVYTGNLLKDSSGAILKERIDHLNTLDKKDLRKYYKERLQAENDNPESKGAGLGLIEVAKRATSKIRYDFQPRGGGVQYFTMYVEI